MVSWWHIDFFFFASGIVLIVRHQQMSIMVMMTITSRMSSAYPTSAVIKSNIPHSHLQLCLDWNIGQLYLSQAWRFTATDTQTPVNINPRKALRVLGKALVRIQHSRIVHASGMILALQIAYWEGKVDKILLKVNLHWYKTNSDLFFPEFCFGLAIKARRSWDPFV